MGAWLGYWGVVGVRFWSCGALFLFFVYSLIARLKLVTRAFDEFGGEYCWDISVIMNVCGD